MKSAKPPIDQPIQARDIRSAIEEQHRHLLQTEDPPGQIGIQQRDTAWLVTVDLPHKQVKLVAKALPSSAGFPEGIPPAWEIHNKLREQCPVVCAMSVPFLGVDPDRSLLFLGFVEGRPLSVAMRRTLSLASVSGPVSQSVRQVGQYLQSLHTLDPAALGITPRLRPNRVFVERFEEIFSDPVIQRWLPSSYRATDQILGRVSDGFLDRSQERFSLVDFQPKNVLVDPDGNAHVIDINYFLGHPAINLAVFLVNIAMIGLYRPTPRVRSRLAAWQRIFLDGYMRVDPNTPRWVANDLVFFYPFIILDLFWWHLRRRPQFKLYLGWFYGRLLRDFLVELNEGKTDRPVSIGIDRYRCSAVSAG